MAIGLAELGSKKAVRAKAQHKAVRAKALLRSTSMIQRWLSPDWSQEIKYCFLTENNKAIKNGHTVCETDYVHDDIEFARQLRAGKDF